MFLISSGLTQLNSSLLDIDLRYTAANGAEWSERGADTWHPFSGVNALVWSSGVNTGTIYGRWKNLAHCHIFSQNTDSYQIIYEDDDIKLYGVENNFNVPCNVIAKKNLSLTYGCYSVYNSGFNNLPATTEAAKNTLTLTTISLDVGDDVLLSEIMLGRYYGGYAYIEYQ